MSCIKTSMPGFSGKDRFVSLVRQGTVLVLCAFLLSSCSPVKSFLSSTVGNSESSPASVAAQGAAPPQSPDQQAEDGKTAAPGLAPLTSATGPPGADDRPPQPGESGREHTADGLPALKPRGVNLASLFAEKTKNDDERFKRLENAVVEMRSDFEAVLPSIVRLVAVEKDMQALMEQLDSLLQNEPPSSPPTAPAAMMEAPPRVLPITAPPPQPAPAPAANAGAVPLQKAQPPPQPPPVAAEKPAEKKAAPSPVAITGPTQVTGVRIGEHADKTRMVLDLSGPAKYSYDLDNVEKLLVLEIPDAGWKGPTQWKAGKSPVLDSWNATPLDGGKGSRMIIQLKDAASVIYETTLAASGQESFRIVIDLAKK